MIFFYPGVNGDLSYVELPELLKQAHGGRGSSQKKRMGQPGHRREPSGMWSALKLQKSSCAIVGGRVVATLRHGPSIQSVLGS